VLDLSRARAHWAWKRSRARRERDFVRSTGSRFSSLKANITLSRWMSDGGHRVDALKLRSSLHPGQYDVAFADPPYAERAGGAARRPSGVNPVRAHHLDRASGGSADSRRRHPALGIPPCFIYAPYGCRSPHRRLSGIVRPITRGHEDLVRRARTSPTASSSRAVTSRSSRSSPSRTSGR